MDALSSPGLERPCKETLSAPLGSSVFYFDLIYTWTFSAPPGSSVYVYTLSAPPGSSVFYFNLICTRMLSAPPSSNVHVHIDALSSPGLERFYFLFLMHMDFFRRGCFAEISETPRLRNTETPRVRNSETSKIRIWARAFFISI